MKDTMTIATKASKPFLKWAGGKHKLLPILSKHLGTGKRLVEPFVGGGSVFLGIDGFDSYWINDVNADLHNLYSVLKKYKDSFVDSVKDNLFVGESNKNDRYYELRDEFNLGNLHDFDRASVFVYLNRHCFNGLCRYNSKGGFNVPFGKYDSIYFPQEELENAISRLNKAKITNLSFEKVFKDVTKDDVVYCDPPYIPIKQKSNFTAYAKDGFSEEQQIQLLKLAQNAKCKVVISNSHSRKTEDLYRYYGAKVYTIDVRRNINANGKDRKLVQEVIGVFNG